MADPSPEREILFLRRVRDLSHLLTQERDFKKLLGLILDAAIELINAERGFLVRVQGRKPDGGYRFNVEVARGFDKASLSGSASEVSRTVVKRVVEGDGLGLVTTDEGHRDVLEVSSVQARQVRSIVCVPMQLRGEVRGVLYLDHRFSSTAFTAEDLPLLRTFADQSALALETAELRAENELEPVPAEPVTGDGPRSLGRLIGASAPMRQLYEEIKRTARTWDPVLIVGEPGTGKDAVAREIHEQGSFPEEPYQVVPCAGGPDPGLALFGNAERSGALLRVGRGTVVLDEVASLPLETQSSLVYAIQERRLRVPGERRERQLHCRIVATTSSDLRAQIATGRFRPELFYRLDVLRIEVPSLRTRPEDIALLFDHLLQFTGRRVKLSSRAQRLLLGYSWPGNVRELDNEVRRLASFGQAQVSAQQLSAVIREGRGVARARPEVSGQTLEQVEQHMVEAAVRDCGGNKSRAARQLGIPRTTLYHLLKRYGLK
ncbi:MAG: sigma-54-dependent Fis family transcriptional regulator [Planctomycetes bacterium]|nr:sigma-54-dependent Fis family transcriptional regulator [Planctomycetota bacterium]